MENTLLVLGIFAYFSIGYYIAQQESQKHDVIKIRFLMVVYTILGPSIVVVYKLAGLGRFLWLGLKYLFETTFTPAKYLPNNRALELELKTEVHTEPYKEIMSSLAEQHKQKLDREKADSLKSPEKDVRPDAKVLQFPGKK